jgi:hypothetical protein
MDNDHDLLVRIDEQVKSLRTGFDTDRIAMNARASKNETDLAAVRKDVDDLATSRAQFYAIAVTLSTVISVLVKVFWR